MLKHQNWIVPKCDSFPLIVSQFMWHLISLKWCSIILVLYNSILYFAWFPSIRLVFSLTGCTCKSGHYCNTFIFTLFCIPNSHSKIKPTYIFIHFEYMGSNLSRQNQKQVDQLNISIHKVWKHLCKIITFTEQLTDGAEVRANIHTCTFISTILLSQILSKKSSNKLSATIFNFP